MYNCFDCVVLSCRQILGSEPTRILYQRGRLLSLEWFRQHGAGYISSLSSVPHGLETPSNRTAKAHSYRDISSRKLVGFPFTLNCFLANKNSVCIVSVLRIVSFDFTTLEDVTYVSVKPAVWSSVEQSVGIICACLPTLRPLVRTLYGSSKNSSGERCSTTPESSNGGSFPLHGSSGDEENIVGIARPSCVQKPLERESASLGSAQGDSGGRGSWLQEHHRDEAERQIPRPISFA